MITQDDAINTAEFGHHYAIQPSAYWWDQEAYLLKTGGKPVAEDFHYSSDTNPVWMTREQLAEILKHESIEL